MKLYKITASWCLSCIYMNNILNDIINENNIDFELISYDYDLDSDVVGSFNVGSILPVYILYKDKEIARLTGEVKKEKLFNFLKDNGGII